MMDNYALIKVLLKQIWHVSTINEHDPCLLEMFENNPEAL